jgi:hypothetical protein
MSRTPASKRLRSRGRSGRLVETWASLCTVGSPERGTSPTLAHHEPQTHHGTHVEHMVGLERRVRQPLAGRCRIGLDCGAGRLPPARARIRCRAGPHVPRMSCQLKCAAGTGITVEDPGSTEEKGAYSAHIFPLSPEIPRSSRQPGNHGAHGHHETRWSARSWWRGLPIRFKSANSPLGLRDRGGRGVWSAAGGGPSVHKRVDRRDEVG